MIVTCTKCNARFRVADEKVGPRGVKVRCSKCQNVFPVRRETGEAQDESPARAVPPPLPRPGGALDLDLEPAQPRPAPDPPGEPQDPFGRQPDPFGAQPDPFEARPPEPDPFAQAGYASDPFGVQQPDPAGAPAPDPLAGQSPLSRAALDPFVATVSPPDTPGGSSLPVTDLSDLLGTGTTPPPPRPAASEAAQAAESAFGAAIGDGLALEDRTTPPPLPTVARNDPFGGADASPFGAPGSFADAELDTADAGGPPSPPAAAFGALELGEPPDAVSAAEPAAPPPEAPRPHAAAPRTSPPPAPPEGDAIELAERIRRRRGARFRSVAVNAVSLAVLLLVSLALVVVWRGEAPLEARTFRPSALLGALGREETAPVTASEVTSGVYERARGAPLLFVKGRILSRAVGPVPAVRVAVEVVRGEAVLARGEALAGAVPTPEELHGADDAAALALLAKSLDARAARPVAPGVPVPFLVAIAEYPADLSGAALRVVAQPEGAPRRGRR